MEFRTSNHQHHQNSRDRDETQMFERFIQELKKYFQPREKPTAHHGITSPVAREDDDRPPDAPDPFAGLRKKEAYQVRVTKEGTVIPPDPFAAVRPKRQ